jgi:glycosyltransferase involved in cell wall biosynthesis
VKILLSSYAFYPSIGGVEVLSAMLAEQFCLRGHEVVVLTDTTGESAAAPYRVVRRPAKGQLWELVRWCDVFVHNNINLRSAWPLLFMRRPWAIINSGSIAATPMGRLKRFCARFAVTSGVSADTARKIGTNTVIPNCYDDDLFRELPDGSREVELMYLGRLVSEKGVDVLLRALGRLKQAGMAPRLTIVGGGPEETSLREMASSLGLDGQVRFAGIRRGGELVKELNSHRILAVPSTYQEPFGIVALEAIACGCVVVGSEGGGLREAIGPCGMTFPNGDATALANCLKELLTDAGKVSAFRDQAADHLARFTKGNVADRYLKILQTLCQASNGQGKPQVTEIASIASPAREVRKRETN